MITDKDLEAWKRGYSSQTSSYALIILALISEVERLRDTEGRIRQALSGAPE